MSSLLLRKKFVGRLMTLLVASAVLFATLPLSTEAAEAPSGAPTVTLNGAVTQTLHFADGEAYTDLGATCSDPSGETITAIPTWTMPSVVPGYFSSIEQMTFHYTCTNSAGLLGSSPERTLIFQHTHAACNDESDNDEDGTADFPADPGCSSLYDEDESNPAIVAGTSFGGGGGRSSVAATTGGEVLGASTSTTSTVPQPEALGEGCGMYLTTYMKYGKKNDAADVARLQTFLNENMGSSLPVSGYFGNLTRNAVKAFQVKYKSDVLTPWVNHGLSADEAEHGTGYVYKTTQHFINNMKCKELNLPAPQIP